ncbi:MAG: hypothetical protein HYV07_05580 [Deltaproteobacteria bacterium]|nr:hypothetical protein [Deltaproteobacteria bacterium]
MAKSATEGIQKVYLMRSSREDSIRDTAVRLFVSMSNRDGEPADLANRAIELAVSFEDVWRVAKESGKLEAPSLDDEMFTP